MEIIVGLLSDSLFNHNIVFSYHNEQVQLQLNSRLGLIKFSESEC